MRKRDSTKVDPSYVVGAKVLIVAMNAAYGTSVPQVNVNAIYATDPFAPH